MESAPPSSSAGMAATAASAESMAAAPTTSLRVGRSRHRFVSIVRTMLAQLSPRSLRSRSLLIIFAPLLLFQLITTWAFFQSHWAVVARALANSLVGEVRFAIETLQDEPEKLADISESLERLMGVKITVFPGQILNVEAARDRSVGFFANRLARAVENDVKKPFLIDTESFDTQVVLQVQLAEGVFQAVIPNERIFSSTTYIFILWMLGTALLFFFIALAFLDRQVRPIRRLARAADRLGKGEIDITEIRYEGATEVRLAARAFNEMRRRIHRLVRQRTDMLSGVSHDLRTPLARMKLQLAMMAASKDTADLATDLREMETMIDSYLSFARSGSQEQLGSTSLSRFFAELSEEWNRQSARARIFVHIENDMEVQIRVNAMKRCFHNLISNARRFAKTIRISAGQRGDMLVVFVDDDGPGIPLDEREQVFKPFFRLATHSDAKTSGLGLAVVRDTIRMHGGDVHLEDAPGSGLRVRIELPL